MSDAISAETTVEVDYSSLVQEILEEASSAIDDMVQQAVSDQISEAVEEYMTYSYDISSAVTDSIGDEISGLLDGVTPGGLCRLGIDFQSAVHTILKHHIDDWDNIFADDWDAIRKITNGNGATAEDLQKLVAEKFNKEMKVEVTFVDKKPATVVSGEVG